MSLNFSDSQKLRVTDANSVPNQKLKYICFKNTKNAWCGWVVSQKWSPGQKVETPCLYSSGGKSDLLS